MDIRFYEDPQTLLPHIYNHQVSEDEVYQILSRPGEDRPAADDSRIAVGQTDAGRYLRVIYVSRGGSDIFVVTAYELTDKQLKAYRRRRRSKK